MAPSCHAGANAFIETYFHDCIYTPRDMVGFLLGIASIGFWMVAQVPQLVTNYRMKRADALSAWFLAEWLLGDTCNLLGCLLKGDQLPTVVFTAEYFICMDAVLLLQYMYYRMIQHRRERTYTYRQRRRHHWREEDVDGVAPSGQTALSPPSSKSRSRGSRRASATTVAALAAAAGGAVVVFAAASRGPAWANAAALPLAAAAGRLGGPATRRLLGGANIRPSSGAGARPVGAGDGLKIVASTNDGALAAALNLGGKVPAWAYEVGVVLGYISSVLYLASRVSQLARTAVRRSAEGLALSMFFVAVAANLTYGGSILVRASSMAEVRAALPWLIGSLGTVALDVAILVQAKMLGTGDDKPSTAHGTGAATSPRRNANGAHHDGAAHGTDLQQPLLVSVEPATAPH